MIGLHGDRQGLPGQLILCLLLVIVESCAGPDDAPAPRGPEGSQPVAVTVARASRRTVQETVDVIGTLWGDEDVTISAKVPGRIAAIYHDVGDRVAGGTLLAQIEKTDFELLVNQKELAVRETLARLGLDSLPGPDFDPASIPTVQRARLQVENAEAKYNRGKQLHDQTPPLLSDQSFADLRTAAAVARKDYDVELLQSHATLAEARARQAELELARQRLADTMVRAPGTWTASQSSGSAPATRDTAREYAIAARMVSVGEYVREGTPMFRLVDDDPVKLRAIAPEKHVADIRVGQKVRVNVEAYTEDFWGTVSRTNPQIDASSRTFQFEVLIPNPGRLLKPGGFARASVFIRSNPGAVFVPATAVVTFAGVSKVYVIRQGKASEIIVEPGQRDGDQVHILSGLSGEESVITSGLNRLANGVPVVISPAGSD